METDLNAQTGFHQRCFRRSVFCIQFARQEKELEKMVKEKSTRDLGKYVLRLFSIHL